MSELIYFILFSAQSTFQLLDKPWSQVYVVPSSPCGSCFQFSSRIGLSNPALIVDFLSIVANSRSRAFRESICAQEKSPRIYTSVHSGGLGLAKLTHVRLEDSSLLTY